jgi:hypothetical protein
VAGGPSGPRRPPEPSSVPVGTGIWSESGGVSVCT